MTSRDKVIADDKLTNAIDKRHDLQRCHVSNFKVVIRVFNGVDSIQQW
jgi:hypothetical protein